MPLCNHGEFDRQLKDLNAESAAGDFSPVYVLFGEEMLIKAAVEHLLARLLPGSAREFAYEPMEGARGSVQEALRRINTYALLNSRKVVTVFDAAFSYSSKDADAILKKARRAYENDNMETAAVQLLSALALLNLSVADVVRGGAAASGLLSEAAIDGPWLADVAAHCRDSGLSLPPVEDEAALLQAAVQKGFPMGHHLILTMESIDRRRQLYRVLEKHGTVVDCSVPAGGRQADKAARESVLKQQMQMLLTAQGKKMHPQAYPLLVERTGFDLRTFCSNLDKLVDYVGDRETIAAADVEHVVKRTRTDPVYAFTDALTDQKTADALFFLNTLISNGMHPLQILTAMVNQIRKLLVVKDFCTTVADAAGAGRMSFPAFQKRVMPLIQAYDRDRIAAAVQETTADAMEDGTATGGKQPAATRSGGAKTDLLLAPNPRSAYPVFKLFQKAERFSTDRLEFGLRRLHQIDVALKQTRQPEKLLLERAVIQLTCGMDGKEKANGWIYQKTGGKTGHPSAGLAV